MSSDAVPAGSASSSSFALRAESLGKRYELGRPRHARLTERLDEALRAPARMFGSSTAAKDTHEEFWALRDVEFEVGQGEAIGVIGRNGAGKSTLLKIVSRITPPTTGTVTVRGRVSTLLEVGTGFHPELTGRENIFLNGAVLGMKRREIGRKYDAIVEFAGVERFLETPVKRYSSGMYVRLAFAVAAHLEPEILLVDEVLAVGDIEFQRKCLGKMRDVAGEGRTVFFVSHNLGAIQRLCGRALLLDGGRLVQDGPATDVVAAYLERAIPEQAGSRAVVPADAQRNGTGEARLREVLLSDANGRPLHALHLGQRFRVTTVFEVYQEIPDGIVEIGISAFGGERIATAHSTDREGPLLRFPPGVHEVSADIDTTILPGEFSIDVGLHHRTGITADNVLGALRLSALNAAESGEDHYPWNVVRGHIRPDATWSGVSSTWLAGEPAPDERTAGRAG
jgi:lipopolysaccharide transport system ATP-binding protein